MGSCICTNCDNPIKYFKKKVIHKEENEDDVKNENLQLQEKELVSLENNIITSPKEKEIVSMENNIITSPKEKEVGFVFV